MAFDLFRLEGCQLEERDENRLWLVRHLEVIRRSTIDDLKVIKVNQSLIGQGYEGNCSHR